MKIKLTIDNKYICIKNASRSAIRKLEKITSYSVAGHYFAPAFKARRWDGKEHLLKYSKKYGYRVPTGLLVNIIKLLKRNNIQYQIIDQRRKPNASINFFWNEKYVLRQYQKDCVEAATNKPFSGRGITVMPIRSGKTITAASIAKKLGVKFVFCVTSQLLLRQTQKVFEDIFQEEIGIIGEGFWNEQKIIVATVQTLDKARGGWRVNKDKTRKKLPTDPRYKPLVDNTDLVFFDECFPAGTIVSGKKIEEIEAGDYIDSFNEFTKEITKQKVTRVYKKNLKRLLEIKLKNGKKVCCTPEHRFFTTKGWVKALDLDSSYMVYNITQKELKNEKEICQNKLSSVRSINHNIRGSKRTIRNNRSCILFKRMFEKICSKNFISNNDKNKFKVCIGKNEKKQSDETPRSEGKSSKHFEKDKTQTTNTRRVWKGINTTSKKFIRYFKCVLWNKSSKMDCRTLYIDREENSKMPNTLQNRYCNVREKNSDRSRWWIARNFESARIGQKERKVFEKTRVESVKVYKQGNKQQSSKLCENNYIYDLEVEKNHTYFANGFAVHNCHHLKGESWRSVFMDFDSLYKIGLSATVYLDNESENEKGVIWLQACCGNVRYRISPTKLIKDKYLMAPKIRLYRITEPKNIFHHKWSKKLPNDAIYENDVRNELICKIANEHVEDGRQVLIVANRINQVEALYNILQDLGLMFVTITGRTSAKERQIKIDDYVEGHYNILLGTVFGEGVDLPSVEVAINAEGGKDIKSTMQKMRNLTPKEGKTKAIYIDFVDMMNPYFAKHSLERLRVYRSEKAFKIKIQNK